MNELLAIALDAHGGLDRWNKLKGLSAGMSISGSTWVIKGQPDLFNNVRIEMPIREQHMVTHLNRTTRLRHTGYTEVPVRPVF
jgi:hypothetical protein